MKELIIRLLNEESGMVVREATSKDITLCQKELAEFEMPSLPSGFVDFLHIANGIAWNGVLFHSTDEVTDEEDDFTIEDIITANEIFQENREMPDRLLLGYSDEDLFTYNTKTEKYEALDFTSGDLMEEYGNFEELFEEVVGGRLDLLED